VLLTISPSYSVNLSVGAVVKIMSGGEGADMLKFEMGGRVRSRKKLMRLSFG